MTHNPTAAKDHAPVFKDARSPIEAYRLLIRDNVIDRDPHQELAAEKLQSLHHALAGYEPQQGAGGWRARLGLTRRPDPAPQGLYLYGGVGRGKSMLMDMFHDTVAVERKRRVHFHEFMLEVHDRLHQLRGRADASGLLGRLSGPEDPVIQLARDLVHESWLLCFDEFHVTDVADAMILGRLFTEMFDHGLVMVATSNVAPMELYKDGLQRQRFLPFIDLLKERVDLLHLAADRDYRLDRLRGLRVYHTPPGPEADQAMQEAFHEVTGGQPGAPAVLHLRARRLEIPRAAARAAWFDFADLCGRPLGAADYLALAAHYDSVFISGIPIMDELRRNEARRFVTLIDALYDHGTKLVVSAEDTPDRLYRGETAAFEFQRTTSRLIEMQSADYLKAAHLT